MRRRRHKSFDFIKALEDAENNPQLGEPIKWWHFPLAVIAVLGLYFLMGAPFLIAMQLFGKETGAVVGQIVFWVGGFLLGIYLTVKKL